jgi:xanthine/CO dehydrogenase XdhC/CoxF family maturation factor
MRMRPPDPTMSGQAQAGMDWEAKLPCQAGADPASRRCPHSAISIAAGVLSVRQQQQQGCKLV